MRVRYWGVMCLRCMGWMYNGNNVETKNYSSKKISSKLLKSRQILIEQANR